MEQKTYTLTLDRGDLAVIGAALSETMLPHKPVAALLTKIGKQVTEAEPPERLIDWQKPVTTADGATVEVLGPVEIHGGTTVMRVRLPGGEALYPMSGQPGADWLPALVNAPEIKP